VLDRRTFARGTALTLVAVALRSHAERNGATRRIGFLTPGPNPREPAFWQGMRELGYVEDKSFVVVRRSAEGDLARLPDLAVQIVKEKPEVIVAIASAAAIAAKQATSTIPIVVVGSSDPIATGLVGNLAHPTGNVTGTSTLTASAAGKLIELVRQLLPGAKRVAAFWDPVNAASQQLRLGETLIAAAQLGLLVRIIELHKANDLDVAFTALESERPDAVMATGDTFFLANAERVAQLGIAHRLPVFSSSRVLTEAGSLASYGPDQAALARRSAVYVQKILNGVKPNDLPIEQPTKFEVVVNARTAKALGLSLPQSILLRADRVIQ
jgi:putative ABC transport system substrate-binding protein